MAGYGVVPPRPRVCTPIISEMLLRINPKLVTRIGANQIDGDGFLFRQNNALNAPKPVGHETGRDPPTGITLAWPWGGPIGVRVIRHQKVVQR